MGFLFLLASKYKLVFGYELITPRKQNTMPETCENPQRVGFLFLLTLSKKTKKKNTTPLEGFLEKPLYYVILRGEGGSHPNMTKYDGVEVV